MERKIRLWTDCDTTIQFLVSQVGSEIKAWNKFAIRSTYLRVRMLADSMEFKIPRTRMESFVLPLLKRLVDKFYPENKESEAHTHYTLEYRREWARLRRAGFYAQDSEKLCKQLLRDQLKFYPDMYTFEEIAAPSETQKEAGVDGLV